MKLKVLFSILFICLLAVASLAQTDARQQKIDISISANNQTFYVNSDDWLVKVKITNNSSEDLSSDDFDGLRFIFEKSNPVSTEDDASGFYDLDAQTIKPGESFQFEANLKKLIWDELPSNDSANIPDSKNRTPYQPVLSGSYTIYAIIPKCEIIRLPLNENACIVPYISCGSNMLAVKVAVKTDK